MKTRSVDMDFHYAEDFGSDVLPEAYERLLLDALQGDASLFARSDEIELAWGHIDPLIAAREDPGKDPIVCYPQGSWGPPEADQLVEPRVWFYDCGLHSNENKQ